MFTAFIKSAATTCPIGVKSVQNIKSAAAMFRLSDAASSQLLETAANELQRQPSVLGKLTFLAERAIRVERVCVVPKRASKADVMLEVLPSLRDAAAAPGEVRAVFVDDDVRELLRPSVSELPTLLRVLFRRTGL